MKKLTIAVMGFTILCACLLPTIGASIKKERDWQEGKLTDIISEPYTVGYVANGTGGVAQLGQNILDSSSYPC